MADDEKSHENDAFSEDEESITGSVHGNKSEESTEEHQQPLPSVIQVANQEEIPYTSEPNRQSNQDGKVDAEVEFSGGTTQFGLLSFIFKKQNSGRRYDSLPNDEPQFKKVEYYLCENKSLLLVFYFTLLVLIGFAMVVNQYIDHDIYIQSGFKDAKSDRDFITVDIFNTEIFVILMMIVAILSIAGFWNWLRWESNRETLAKSANCGDNVMDQNAHPDEHQETSEKEHSITYLLGSVFVFATGTFLLMVIEITDYFHCGVHLSKERSESQTQWEEDHYPTHFVFFLTQLIFTMAQVFFLSKFFSSSKLSKSSLLVLLLVHLLATNVIIAFFYFASETGIFLSNAGKEINVENLTCANLNGTSDYLHTVLHQARPYLEPFVIDYALISGALLFSMILRAVKIIKKRKASQQVERLFLKGIDMNGKAPRQPNPASELTDDSHLTKKNEKAKEIIRKQPSALFLFVIGIVLALFMIVSSWALKGSSHYEDALIATYSIQIVVFFTEIICSAYILRNLPILYRQHRSLETDDRLLLITVGIGVVALNTFTFIAALGVTKKESLVVEGTAIDPRRPATLLLFFCLINVASCLTQTYTIIEAQRFTRPRTSQGRRLLDAPTGPVLFLLAMSLGHWIQVAFFEIKNDGSKTFPFGQKFYSQFAWQIITRGVYPLCILFRFHAAAMLFDVWRKFAPKDSVWVLNEHSASIQSKGQFIKGDGPLQYPRHHDVKREDAAFGSWDPV